MGSASMLTVAADIPLFGMGILGVLVIGLVSFMLGRARRRTQGRARRRRSLLRPRLED